MHGLKEIPVFRSVEGWKQVPIQESEEPLISLEGLDPQIIFDPQYFKQGIPGALSTMYLRAGGAERLITAARMLPPDLTLLVWDSYRPLGVQESLFNAFCQQLRSEYVSKSDEEIREMAQTYVSIPSSDSTRPSPHSTGGAIDLTVADRFGRPLSMGTDFDSFDIQTRTDYLKTDPIYEVEHTNRRLLYTVMTDAGFTNYPEEWWHFDYGNQLWGMIKGQSAVYNLAKLPTEDRPIPADARLLIHRLRDDSYPERSLRVGLAGNEQSLALALEALRQVTTPYFALKQKLVDSIINPFNVVRVAI